MLLSLSGVPDMGSRSARPPIRPTQPLVVVKTASKDQTRPRKLLGQNTFPKPLSKSGVVGQPDHRIRQQLQRPAGQTSGGLAQAVATSNASSLSDSLRDAPSRGSSCNAAGRLPSTKRRFVRWTVEVPTPTPSAITSSLVPASASEQDPRSFELARRLPAAAQHPCQGVALRLAQLHPVMYVHPVPRSSRARDGHHLPEGRRGFTLRQGRFISPYPRLPAPARPRPRRSRHPTLLSRQPAISAPDAADARGMG